MKPSAANIGKHTHEPRTSAPSTLVAGVAGGRAVAVAADSCVLPACPGLRVRAPRVAINAGKAGVVRGDLMAIVANRAIMGNSEIGVIKRRAEPTGGGVAGRARRGIAGGDVIRHRAAEGLRAVPVSDMAAVAIRRQCAGVVVVDVAGGAGRGEVRAREWESRGGMIEFPVHPGDRVMATGAHRGRKTELDVVHGSSSRVVFVHVATLAGRWRRGIICAWEVALRTLQSRVRIGQRKKRVVVEIGGVPACGRMAIRAISGSEVRPGG